MEAHLSKTVQLAQKAGIDAVQQWNSDTPAIELLKRFEDLVRADERNRLAKECALLPFGDTAASFAVWIRNGGKP